MTKSLVIEFSAEMVERIEKMMETFGETSPEGVILRALGLMETVKEFVLDRQLTVVDYRARDGEQFVELEFGDATIARQEKEAA